MANGHGGQRKGAGRPAGTTNENTLEKAEVRKLENLKTSYGGKRKGAGRPKGMKWESTMEKAVAQERTRLFVTGKLDPLLAAAFDNAVGIRHLMKRDPKTGQLVRVTGSPHAIDKALKSGAFWIYTKDPNIQTFTDLMNRAIDKPSEHVKVAGADGGPIIIQWMRPGEDESDSEVNALPDAEKKND